MEFIPSRARNPYHLPCCLAVACDLLLSFAQKSQIVQSGEAGGGAVAYLFVSSVIKGFSLGLFFNYPITQFLFCLCCCSVAFDVVLAKSQKPRANGLFFNYQLQITRLSIFSNC